MGNVFCANRHDCFLSSHGCVALLRCTDVDVIGVNEGQSAAWQRFVLIAGISARSPAV